MGMQMEKMSVTEELGFLPERMRPVILELLKCPKVTETAKRLRVNASHVYFVRSEAADILGYDSPLVKKFAPKMVKKIETESEVRCTNPKCGLRGHTADRCDFRTIDDYAAQRYSSD